MKYDVFISYRRDGGYETALPIVEKLRSAGYRVFFDLESMNPGKFNEQLLNVIDNCTDFILVLPEHGLDRCSSEDDWVRREVERALADNKNIIPVMLRGFSWPDTLPESMAELPNYQGISATAPEHFDMAVQRLKSYLKSRPRRPVAKWMKICAATAGVLVVLTAIGWLTFRQLAKPVATRVSTQMTLAMGTIHSMYGQYLDFNNAWEIFTEQRAKSSPQTVARLDSTMIANIDGYWLPALRKTADTFPPFERLSVYDRWLLGFYDVDPADVDGLDFVVKAQLEEFEDNMEMFKEVVNQKMFNTYSNNSLREARKADEYGMNSLYYAYLATMARMPKDSRTLHRQTALSWSHFPTVSDNLSAEEYETMSARELEKVESAIKPKEALVQMLENQTNIAEEYLSGLETVLNGLGADAGVEVENATSAEVEAARERVDAKRQEVEQMRRDLADAEQALREQFESFKLKFAIAPDDDQYYKWGKVCKAASNLALTIQNNITRIRQGIDPVVTNQDALRFVLDQLDAYRQYHPDANGYSIAAKAFYIDVAARRRPLEGMIVMGTQNDLEHPLLKVGDIIVERNGTAGLTDMEKYRAAAAKASPGTIKFLRYRDGRLSEVSADMPLTDVNIGLLPLRD